MAVRDFDGVDDRILVDDGTVGQLANGAFTLLLLIKPMTGFTSGATPISVQNGSNQVVGLVDNASGRWACADDNEYIDSSSTALVGIGNWYLTAVTCTGSAATPRFHGRQLGTGSWTHVNGSGGFTGNTLDADGIEFGSFNNGSFSSFWEGRIAVAAVFNSALSDGAIEAIETAATTQSIYDLTPLSLWEFNQANVATDVTDIMGNGANETAITGTTVVTTDDPTWTFYGGSPPPTPPGINYDSATEAVRTDTSDPYTFDFTPTNQPQGVVLAAVHGVSTTDHISSVTCDGVAMSRVTTATDSATEPGRADLWFLGKGVPSGTLTFSIDFSSATTDDFHFVAIALTTDAGGNVVVVDSDTINANVADPSVTLQYGNRECISIAALYGGGADGSVFTPNGNCTTVHDHDLGNFYSEVIRQTTPGTADFAIGGTATSDDVAYVAAAFAEQITLPSLVMAPMR